MISVEDALRIVCREAFPLVSETVPLSESVGRTLSESVIADSDMPPFDRSQMDGFAVRAEDTIDAPVCLRLVGESAAGRGWHHVLQSGEAVAIMTGAPIPEGANAVQKIELTRAMASSNSGEAAASNIEIVEPTEEGRYIVNRGSEICQGEVIFQPGSLITDAMIATLAAFGYSYINVGRQPRISILGTGSEIVEIGDRPGRDQIRNSNSSMLTAMARRRGASPSVCPNVKDNLADLKTAINDAAESSDVVVITGGVSVGKYDLTKTAIAELGTDVFFERVKLKPGKPTVFGRLRDTFIFGLPGNPVSAAVTFHLFVEPVLAILQGRSDPSPKVGFAIVSAAVEAARERQTYLPAALSSLNSGYLSAEPLRWNGSSDFIGFARADALIVLEKGTSHSNGDCIPIEYL
ncbi:MAG: gephyrin-like molybdotransferase Glp [Acidobacteriota bacterium]